MEVGRASTVDFGKGDFIGRSRLLEQKESGIHRRMVQFQVRTFKMDRDSWPWQGEAVYRNGEYVG